jgi:hypothetical protein
MWPVFVVAMTEKTKKLGRPAGQPNYPPEIKQLAYELWWLKCGRSWTRLQEALKSGSDGPAVDVSVPTLRYWAEQERWAERSINDFKAVAPSMQQNIFQSLVTTTMMAVEQLQSDVHQGKPIDKSLISLAVAYLDRIGFSPVGKNEPSKVLDDIRPATAALPDLSKLSPEELQALESRYRSSKP